MHRLAFILLLSLLSASFYAQSINETAYLVVDKSVCQPLDTLYINGMLLNPERNSVSKISNYCYLELLSRDTKVLQRVKVACTNGLFAYALPLDAIPDDNYYFVRAYTRYMQNFPPTTYPVQLFRVGKQRQVLSLAQRRSSFPFQLRYKDGMLLYKLDASPADDGMYQLTVAADDGSMESISLSERPRDNLLISNKKPPYVLNCFVANLATDSILFQQYISVGQTKDSHSLALSTDQGKPDSALELCVSAGSDSVDWLIHIEPVGEKQNPITLLRQLCDASIMKGEAYKQLIKGNRIGRYLPEQVLSIQGSIRKESVGRLKSGVITAFDSQRGFHYDADIQPDGTFIMGVDDYAHGTTFFLQAFNRKGKSHHYEIELPMDTFPDLYLPPLKGWNERERVVYGSLDTTRVHWIPEVQVKARIIRPEPPSTPTFFKKNYLEAEDLKKGSYKDLESVYRQLVGVKIAMTDGGLPYLISTRGGSFLESAMASSEHERLGLKIRVDGVWESGWDIYNVVHVSDISSIEYIPPSRANLYGSGNLSGLVEIKTKKTFEGREPVRSAGTLYQPLGLSASASAYQPRSVASICQAACEAARCTLRLPSLPGRYRVVAQGVSRVGGLFYLSQEVEVE